MERFFILTYCDLVRYGDGVKDVIMYDNLDEAKEAMKKSYLAKCAEDGIEDPYDEHTYGLELGDTYAYISGRYYWDIFNRDLNGRRDLEDY